MEDAMALELLRVGETGVDHEAALQPGMLEKSKELRQGFPIGPRGGLHLDRKDLAGHGGHEVQK